MKYLVQAPYRVVPCSFVSSLLLSLQSSLPVLYTEAEFSFFSLSFSVAPFFWFRKKNNPEWTKGNFLEHTTARVKRDGQTKSCLVVGLVAFWNMLWLPIHSFTSGLSQLTLSQVLLPHTTHDSQPLDMKVFCPLKQHWKEVCKIICILRDVS